MMKLCCAHPEPSFAHPNRLEATQPACGQVWEVQRVADPDLRQPLPANGTYSVVPRTRSLCASFLEAAGACPSLDVVLGDIDTGSGRPLSCAAERDALPIDCSGMLAGCDACGGFHCCLLHMDIIEPVVAAEERMHMPDDALWVAAAACCAGAQRWIIDYVPGSDALYTIQVPTPHQDS